MGEENHAFSSSQSYLGNGGKSIPMGLVGKVPDVHARYTTPADAEIAEDKKNQLCIVGSGDFGRALATRAVQSGYNVVIATRNVNKDPKLRSLIEATGAKLLSHEEALVSPAGEGDQLPQLVVVAVSRDRYSSLPLHLLADKTLVDVSNTTLKQRKKSLLSNAEYLQTLAPKSSVVKAFNVLSAYLLQSGAVQGSKEVPLASDSSESRDQVSQLVRELGLTPVDMGPLRWSRDIEKMPLEFFSQWQAAFTVSAAIFAAGYVINLIKFQFCSNLTKNDTWDWSVFKEILMTNFNRNLAVCALIILAAVYLPGVIAGYIQLYRGTKYSRFPGWLDRWLRMRKQLGLIMLCMASVHGCISLGIYHPHHQYNWLFENPKVIRTDVQNSNGSFSQGNVSIWFHNPSWRGELFLTVGAVSLCLLAILGITSLPSVTAVLTWREFAFIQSKLGWAALVAASIHDGVLGGDFMLTNYSCYLPTGLQMALYLPILCVVGKVILLLPPINRRLMKIRGGWVSDKAVSMA